jgi:hypothetical protein
LNAAELRAGVVPVLTGASSGAQKCQKISQAIDTIVLPLNNERGGKAFLPQNSIKNLWVVVFNLAVVPNNLPFAINNLPDAPNNLPLVPK